MEFKGKQKIHRVIEEYGQLFKESRKFCFSKCANLLDTHELTVVEKKCVENCYKKTLYAFTNFNQMINQDRERLENISEPQQEFKY